MVVLVLATALAGCQNVRVNLGETRQTPTGSAAGPSVPNPGNIPGGVITVQRGETIYEVSQRTGAPVRDLIDANHLRPPYRLESGRTLIVPRTPTHVVQHGETLYSIAEGEGVELYSLARMNELTQPFALRQGEVLKLPPRVARPLAPASPLPEPPPGKPDVRTARVAPVSAQPLPPGGSQTSVLPTPPPQKPMVASLSPPAQTPAASAVEPQPELSAPPPRTGRFMWPVQGNIIGGFECRSPAALPQMRTNGDIFTNGEPGERLHNLEGARDAKPGPFVRRLGCNIRPIVQNATLVGLQKPRDDRE